MCKEVFRIRSEARLTQLTSHAISWTILQATEFKPHGFRYRNGQIHMSIALSLLAGIVRNALRNVVGLNEPEAAQIGAASGANDDLDPEMSRNLPWRGKSRILETGWLKVVSYSAIEAIQQLFYPIYVSSYDFPTDMPQLGCHFILGLLRVTAKRSRGIHHVAIPNQKISGALHHCEAFSCIRWDCSGSYNVMDAPFADIAP